MHKTWILFLIVCFSILVIGCQATPETPPVIYQGNDYLNDDSAEESVALDVVDQLHNSVDMNGLLINFDSNVFVPRNKSYSVVEIEKANFSTDDIKKYIEYFSPNGTELLKANTLTKSQITKLMIGLEDVSSDSLPEDIIEMVQNELNCLFETAPEDISENDARFSFDDIKTGENFEAYALAKDDTYCQYNGVLDGNSFSYIRNSYTIPTPQSYFSENDPEWKDFSGEFPISEEAAIDTATKVLIDLGIDNMEVTYAERACAYHYLKVQSVESKGWRVVFTRTSNGIPSIYVDGACLWNTSDAPALGAPWDKEVIFVTVDEAGVYSFDWRGAGKQKKVLVENVDLLPFENILERAEKQLMYQHLPQNKEKAEFSITVKKISLDSALVNIANETNLGRMIPVWDFYYDIVYKEGDSSETETYVLTLNAIDGRYIEPRITKTTIDQVSTSD